MLSSKGTGHWKFWGGSGVSNHLCLHKKGKSHGLKKTHFTSTWSCNHIPFLQVCVHCTRNKTSFVLLQELPWPRDNLLLGLGEESKNPPYICTVLLATDCHRFSFSVGLSKYSESFHGWSPGSALAPLCSKCFNSSGDNALCLLPSSAQTACAHGCTYTAVSSPFREVKQNTGEDNHKEDKKFSATSPRVSKESVFSCKSMRSF